MLLAAVFFVFLRTSQTVPAGNSCLCISVENSCHVVSPTAAHFYSEKNYVKMFLSLKFPFKCCFDYMPEIVWFDGLALLTMKMSTFIPHYHPLYWRYCSILIHNKPAGPLHIPSLWTSITACFRLSFLLHGSITPNLIPWKRQNRLILIDNIVKKDYLRFCPLERAAEQAVALRTSQCSSPAEYRHP